VDDHQTTNAKFLVDVGAGWLVQQRELTPESLADLLQKLDRSELLQRALAAKRLEKTEATEQMVAACEALAR
jgi:UDP-N-acetylglucosamine--N-acetylmuramyl-(pentapeptide) pyrophosphoryl-undecaprenol N-acetylglucosamine transferase